MTDKRGNSSKGPKKGGHISHSAFGESRSKRDGRISGGKPTGKPPRGKSE